MGQFPASAAEPVLTARTAAGLWPKAVNQYPIKPRLPGRSAPYGAMGAQSKLRGRRGLPWAPMQSPGKDATVVYRTKVSTPNPYKIEGDRVVGAWHTYSAVSGQPCVYFRIYKFYDFLLSCVLLSMLWWNPEGLLEARNSSRNKREFSEAGCS